MGVETGMESFSSQASATSIMAGVIHMGGQTLGFKRERHQILVCERHDYAGNMSGSASTG